MVVMDKWVSQVCNSGWDTLGWLSYVTIKGKKDRKVTIISAYRVFENNLDQAGPTTCWMQQWCQLKKQGYSNPNSRKIFLQDFSKFVEKCIINDKELIIGMDANDEGLMQSDFHKFHRENDLVYVFTHIYPTVTPPTTYQRGQNRLDYIFIISALIPALRSTGFLPYNIPFSSDHGAAYAHFDKEILFMG
eukprot:2850336-Ditylum_brightwellii.AAC.1